METERRLSIQLLRPEDELRSQYKAIPNFSGYGISKDCEIINLETFRVMLPYTSSNGYLTIKLKDDNGKRRSCLIHRIVHEAYASLIPKGMWINHKDGNKQNNLLENLEVTTPSENHKHAYQVLKRNRARGISVHTATISPEGEEAVHALLSLGWSQTKIARALSVSQSCISQRLKKPEKTS